MFRFAFLLLAFGPMSLFAADKKPAVLTFTLEKGETLDLKPVKDIVQIKNADELAKLISDEKLRKRIASKVDFKTYTLLIFCWKGSGEDKLEYRVGGSDPELIFFNLQPGFTKDLKTHLAIHAVRNDCKWSAK